MDCGKASPVASFRSQKKEKIFTVVALRVRKKGMMGVALTVTSLSRDNAQATGRCSLRAVILAESPSYSDVLCSVPSTYDVPVSKRLSFQTLILTRSAFFSTILELLKDAPHTITDFSCSYFVAFPGTACIDRPHYHALFLGSTIFY